MKRIYVVLSILISSIAIGNVPAAKGQSGAALAVPTGPLAASSETASEREHPFISGSEPFILVLENTSPNSTEPVRIDFFSATGSMLGGRSLPALNPLERIEIPSSEIPAGSAGIVTRGSPVVVSGIESTAAISFIRRFRGTSHVILPGLFDTGIADRHVTVWNPANKPASILVSVIDREGSPVATASLSLEPMTMRTTRLQDLFQDADISSAFAARLISDQTITGAEESSTSKSTTVARKALVTMQAVAATPSDLETHIRQTIKDIITITVEPPDDWGRLLTLQFTGQLNRYFQLYDDGVEARGAAALKAIAALKTLQAGNQAAAQSIYNNALLIWIESNTLFGAAAQLNVSAIDQVDDVLKEIHDRSFQLAGVLCLGNEFCGYAIDGLDAGSEYAITSALSGKSEAQRELAATILVKGLLEIKVDGTSISDAISKNINHVTGSGAAPYFGQISKVLRSPDTAKTVLKLFASANVQITESKLEDSLKQMDSFYSEQAGGMPVSPPPAPPTDVWVQLPQTAFTVQQGQSVKSLVTLQRHGFGGSFPLYVLVQAGIGSATWDPIRNTPPLGLTITFSPAAPTAADSPTMTITAASSLTPGLYRILVEGIGVSVVSHGFFATLNVTAKPVLTPLSITTTSVPSATVGVGYQQGIAVTGGKAPYTWSVSSGLPSGLALNTTTGAIFGTPTAAGTFNFTVAVRDAGNPQSTASRAYSLAVAAATTPLSITTTSVPSATVGVGYQQGIAVTGGKAPYTWSVSSGLPSGLALNTTTGAIFGTPAAAGTFSFTVAVRDASNPQHTASRAYSLTVSSAAPTVSAVSPSTISKGTSSQRVTITGNGFTSTSYHQFSINGGNSWTFATSPPTIGGSTSMTIFVNNTVVQRIYFRVCTFNGSSLCSAGSVNVSVQ